MDFHFGIEVNSGDFLWIHGSLGDHAWKWTLRCFWRIEHWLISS